MKLHHLAAAVALAIPTIAIAATSAAPSTDKTSPTVPAITAALGTVGATAIPAPTSTAATQTPAAATAPIPSPTAETPPPSPTLAGTSPAPEPHHHYSRRVSRANAAFDMRQRDTIAEHIAANSQSPTTARANGTATTYKFADGQLYIVYGGLERITSIDLEPGEEVTGPIQAGDTVRWLVATVTSGSGAQAQTHIIVKPTDAGAVTNMMIATNKRTYMLDLRATQDWYMPSVRFTYPAEEWARMNAASQVQAHASDTVTPIAASSPESLHFEYRMSGRDYHWKPVQVFDDGLHTYIRMPANLASTDAPALFVIDGGKPLLVNYRVKGTGDQASAGATYIVDRLFDRAELRVGTSQVVTIRRQ